MIWIYPNHIYHELQLPRLLATARKEQRQKASLRQSLQLITMVHPTAATEQDSRQDASVFEIAQDDSVSPSPNSDLSTESSLSPSPNSAYDAGLPWIGWQPDLQIQQFLSTYSTDPEGTNEASGSSRNFNDSHSCMLDGSFSRFISPFGYTFGLKFMSDVCSLQGCSAAAEILVYDSFVLQCIAIQKEHGTSEDFKFQCIEHKSDDLQRPNWLDLQSLVAPETSSWEQKWFWILSMLSPIDTRRQLKWVTKSLSVLPNGVSVQKLQPCPGFAFSMHHQIESTFDLLENRSILPHLLQLHSKDIDEAKKRAMECFTFLLVAFLEQIPDHEERAAFLDPYEEYCNRLAEVEEEACLSILITEFDGIKYSEMTQDAKQATQRLFASLRQNACFPRDPSAWEMAQAAVYSAIMSWWMRGFYSLNDLQHAFHETSYCPNVSTARGLLQKKVKKWHFPLIIPGWIPQNLMMQVTDYLNGSGSRPIFSAASHLEDP